ncbi:hypothetical protein CBS101457_000393 [Exobasidium rhododendri]|nr:hypothetical protein CBS101457_000393 [Exobasidium rhododendri]
MNTKVAPQSTPTSSSASTAARQTQQAAASLAHASNGGGEVPPSPAKKQAPTPVEALSSTLKNSKLAEDSLVDMNPVVYKRLILNQDIAANAEGTAQGETMAGSSSSSINEKPSLSTQLHDRIWAQGGELVMQLGEPKEFDENGDAVSRKMFENVELVNVAFSAEELQEAIANIRQACLEGDCESAILFESSGTSKGNYAFLMLRRIPSGAQELLELRVAVIGNVDAGKSSTLGVLTRGGLDDGRGKARVNLFRHKHEIESGRTSSVGMEIMGYDTKGDIIMNMDKKNPSEPGRKMSWEEVCGKSAKVISFIDLAGHERYLKTTVGGLTGCLPDFVMLMVGANAGLIGMSKEHLGVALALSVPVLVCITKIDMTPPHILEATIKQLVKILRSPGCRKTPIFVENQEQVVDSALRLGKERICPVFQISNVTGQNLNLLRSFLNILPQANAAKFSRDAPFKFQLQDVFSVPFVGCVVSGVILGGVVRVGDNLIIGPDSLGQFTNTSVRSIQRKRVNVDAAVAGQSASFALKRIRRNQVRKGMVMMSKTDVPPKAFLTCDAEILCLYHSTTLSIGSCMVLHAASIRQTVKIVQIAKLDSQGNIVLPSTSSSSSPPSSSSASGGAGETEKGAATESEAQNGKVELQTYPSKASRASSTTAATSTKKSSDRSEKPVVRTGDRALLRFQFIRTAEFLEPGLKLITREAGLKLIGVIRSCGDSSWPPNLKPNGDTSATGSSTSSSGAAPIPPPPAQTVATASA